MPKPLFNLLKQGNVYLVISWLVFSLSLKAAIFFFTCFLLTRILFYDSFRSEFESDKLASFIKIALSLAIATSSILFYIESRSHFYPVSYYDYLFILITTLIIRLFPLSKSHVKQVCLAISLSPVIVFVSHINNVNFESRNNWGFDNPNGLGLYCSICIPIIACQLISCLFIVSAKKELKNRVLLILLALSLIICLIMMIFSGSRSSFYPSLLILTLITLLNLNIKSKAVFKYLCENQIGNYTIFYLVTIISSFVYIYKFVFSKFIFIRRFVNLTNSTNLYRTYVYKCYLKLGLEKPWWGWGIDKTSALCEQKLTARYGGVNHAHNFALQLFADHGALVAILCLASIAYFILLPTVKFIINYDRAADSILYLGICLSSLSILIVSLFQSSFYHYPLFPLWLGLLWGIQLNFYNATLGSN